MKSNHPAFVIYLLLGLLTACTQDANKADLIIQNATIWTANDKQETAKAMAIAGDTVLAIGTHEEMERFQGGTTTVVDMQGGFITPGFIDCHVHLMSMYSVAALMPSPQTQARSATAAPDEARRCDHRRHAPRWCPRRTDRQPTSP